MQPNINVFHCNDNDRCQSFIEDYNNLVYSKEDGIWLGDGMYFWDNLSNAKYWYNNKIRKNKSNSYEIITGYAYLSKMLDLTDLDICDKVEKIWLNYKEKLGIVGKPPLGKKINVIFENMKPFKDSYNIIKIYGKYNKTPKMELYTYDILSDSCEPTAGVKCIYSVRDSSCLCNFSYFNKEGNEMSYEY